MNNLHQNAKFMFEQSTLYMYEEYRREGMPEQEAKQQVAKDIEEMYSRYAEKAELPKRELTVRDPLSILDNAISYLSRQKEPLSVVAMKTVIGHLTQARQLLTPKRK